MITDLNPLSDRIERSMLGDVLVNDPSFLDRSAEGSCPASIILIQNAIIKKTAPETINIHWMQ
jgi:hypothetical protein